MTQAAAFDAVVPLRLRWWAAPMTLTAELRAKIRAEHGICADEACDTCEAQKQLKGANAVGVNSGFEGRIAHRRLANRGQEQ